jgi:two-component system chemotaxis response regulator CheB
MEENSLNKPGDVLLIGGSAGSLTVLFDLLPYIRPGFPLAVILVLHRKNSADSSLSALLSLKTAVPVKEIEDKDPVSAGYIYLAPADYHTLIEKNSSFSLDYSEKVNFSRPSLDVTFESAADVYGTRLTAIILSGANEDGTKGLAAIKKAGGTIMAQNPGSAQMPFMPQYAIEHLGIGLILTPVEMAQYLQKIAGESKSSELP